MAVRSLDDASRMEWLRETRSGEIAEEGSCPRIINGDSAGRRHKRSISKKIRYIQSVV
jgi:hypothetical protein